MHLRRALLLFAIVLALAAIAASVSRPREEGGASTERAISPPPTEREEPPTASPGAATDAGVTELRFDAAEKQRLRIAGGAATVLVEVEEAGQVEIADLGLSAAADPLTPAVFEVFASESARHEISFTPADDDETRAAGTLLVGPAPR